MEKGLMTENVEVMVVELLDESLKFEGIKETTSDLALKFGLPLLDNHLLDSIRDDIQLPIQEAGEFFINKQYDKAIEKIADASAILIKVKGVNETDKQRLARKTADLFLDYLQVALKAKKAA